MTAALAGVPVLVEDPTWAVLVLIALAGLGVLAVAAGAVVRMEQSEGLDDDLDRDL